MNEEEKQRNVSVSSIKKINECHGYGFMSASPEWLHLLCCRLLSSDRCGKNIISKGGGGGVGPDDLPTCLPRK